MIQAIRDKLQGPITWAIIVIIAVAFAVIGGDTFTKRFSGNSAANVDGEDLGWDTVEKWYQHQLMQAQKNQTLTADQKNILYSQVRNQLVQNLAFNSQLKKIGYSVADKQVMNNLQADKRFSENDKFSKEKYQEFLKHNRLSEQGYEDLLRDNLMQQQLGYGLAESSSVYDSELAEMHSLWMQTRDFGYVVVPARRYEKDADVSEESIKDYYALHKHEFVAPERIKIAYVNLNLDKLSAKVEYTDEEVENFYNERIKYFSRPERVQVSHVLITVPQDASEAQDKEAKSQIEDIYAKLSQGADFARLAKENSMDVISAKQGGDLGWVDKGRMVPEFEEAAFSLNEPGDLSQIVKTNYGYHIIKLTRKQDRRSMPLDEVREYVISSLQRDRAEEDYAKLGEKLGNLAFENPDSLEAIKRELDLEIHVSDYITREDLHPLPAMMRTQMVSDLAFNEDFIKQGRNSEVVTANAENYVVLRVVDHKAAYIKDETSVHDEIRTKLIRDHAAVKAKEVSDIIATGLSNEVAPNKLADEHHLEWQSERDVVRYNNSIPADIVQGVFFAPRPEDGKSSIVNFMRVNGDSVVIALTKVVSPKSDLFTDKNYSVDSMRQQLKQARVSEEIILYRGMLIDRAKIKVNSTKRGM